MPRHQRGGEGGQKNRCIYKPVFDSFFRESPKLQKYFYFCIFVYTKKDKISIFCNKEELKQIHSRFGLWNDNIQGFALNNSKQIFVKNNELDSLMLTIGHEIGHVYTRCLTNNHDEEAKTFSFAMQWAKIISKTILVRQKTDCMT